MIGSDGKVTIRRPKGDGRRRQGHHFSLQLFTLHLTNKTPKRFGSLFTTLLTWLVAVLGKLLKRGHIMKTTLFLGFGVLFWVSGEPTRIQTLKKVPRLQLPNERVSFGTPSYVGRGQS